MASSTETLTVKIIANTKEFSSAMSQMSNDLKGVSKDFDGLRSVGDKLSSVGSTLTKYVTAPLAGVGVASAKMSIDFENSFAKVSTLLDSGKVDYNSYKSEVKNASREMGVSVNDFCEALYQSMSAGVKSGDAIKFTSDMVKLAKGGFTDTATAVDLTTTILNSYGKEAGSTTQIMDKLINTQNLGKTTVAELGSSLGTVIPIAKSCGVSFNDMLASMATMTAGGISTAESTTYLKSMINELGKSGTKVSDILKQQTGKSFQELNAEGVPLGDTLKVLKDYADKNGVSFQDLFGSSEAATAALALMGDEGVTLQEKLKGISETTGSCDEAFKKVEDTAGARLSKALNSLKISLIDIGGALAPLIEAFASFISTVAKIIGKFGELNPVAQSFILVLTGIIMAIGPLLSLAGSLIGLFANLSVIMSATGGASLLAGASIGSIAIPILSAIAVIGSLIAFGIALYQNWDTIKAGAEQLVSSLGVAWQNICAWGQQAWTSLCNIVSQAWQTICNVVQVGIMTIVSILNASVQIITLPFQFIWQNCQNVIMNVWNSIYSFLSGIISNIANFINSKFQQVSNFISSILSVISSTFSSIWNSISSFMSSILSSIFNILSSKFNSMKNTVSSISNAIRSVISNAWNGIRSVFSSITSSIFSVVSSKFNSIRNTVSSVISNMKSIVSSGLSAIRGFFSSCRLALPHIKMPHFRISGTFSLNPPKVPSFSVSWYSKGAIFKRPSVFGGIGVGDRHNGVGSGAEAVLPIDKLPQLLGLDKNDNGGNVTLNIENFNNNREQDIKQLLRELEFYRKRANRSVGGAY